MKSRRRAARTVSALSIGRQYNRRSPGGRHSTRPLEGNTVKFSVHRVGQENYRRFDTILSHDLVQATGLQTGDRVDVRFSKDMRTAVILKAGDDQPATRLQKRRESERPHGLIAVRIPVNGAVSVPCVDAEIVRAERGRVRVKVPDELREKLMEATDLSGAQ